MAAAPATRLWWLPAVALGVLGAGGAWALDALLDPPPGPQEPDRVALRFPFLRGPAVDPACVPACLPDVLVVRGGETTLAQAAAASPGATAVVLPSEADVRWLTDDVGVLAARDDGCPPAPAPPCDRAGPHVARGAAPADRASALVTFFVFLDDGRVQAANADDAELAPFERAGDFLAMPHVPYALAPGASGVALPSFLDAYMPGLRRQLATLPDGAVLTQAIEQHPLADVLGTLHVTARIDPFTPPRSALDRQAF